MLISQDSEVIVPPVFRVRLPPLVIDIVLALIVLPSIISFPPSIGIFAVENEPPLLLSSRVSEEPARILIDVPAVGPRLRRCPFKSIIVSPGFRVRAPEMENVESCSNLQ